MTFVTIKMPAQMFSEWSRPPEPRRRKRDIGAVALRGDRM